MEAKEEIKDRLPIEDVVGRYVDLKRSGSNLKGLCPFHQEKTPSFYVSPSRGVYKCFGCGKSGDIFSFTMEMNRVAFPDALRQLAEQAGVTLPERRQETNSLAAQLYAAHELACASFHDTLKGPAGARGRRYLEERGFGSEAIELFQLGVAPEGRDVLVRHLRQAGYDDRIILAAGLALQDDLGGRVRDRFWGRLMFPIKDRSGRIVGFGGRTMGDAQPKYLNSPQTEIFDKSSVLFGIHLAVDSIQQARRAVLVEGYLDAIRAHLGGYGYTIASLGTAVTPKQLATLSRLTERVIVALDPDPAGQSAAARASLTALAEVTKERGRMEGEAGALNLAIARLPEGGGDPDELIRDHPERWEECLEAAIPAFDFFFQQSLDLLDRSTEQWRQQAIDRLLPVIQQFATSAGWQAVWLQRLAQETGVDLHALQRAVPPGNPSRAARRTQRVRESENGKAVVADVTARQLTRDPTQGVQDGLLSLLLQLMVIPDDAAALLEPDILSGDADRELLRRLLEWRHNSNYDYEMFRETLDEETGRRADELRALGTPLPPDGKASIAVALHLARLRQLRVHAQVTQISQFLQGAEPGDAKEMMQILSRLTREQREVEEALEKLGRLSAQSSGAAPP